MTNTATGASDYHRTVTFLFIFFYYIFCCAVVYCAYMNLNSKSL